jgi:hypothetical protein
MRPNMPTSKARLLTVDLNEQPGDYIRRLHQTAMLRSQERILQPLPATQRVAFVKMLRALVTANNSLSRAPSDS